MENRTSPVGEEIQKMLIDKTNWYTCLLQPIHKAIPDQPIQGHQYIKAIEQYLKIKATSSPKNYIHTNKPNYVNFSGLDVSVLSRIKPYIIKGL
jgi:hypothetical protein